MTTGNWETGKYVLCYLPACNKHVRIHNTCYRMFKLLPRASTIIFTNGYFHNHLELVKILKSKTNRSIKVLHT